MFSRLPPEVISDHIFPFLLVNDLLRLRRVCTVSKELADDYLRVYGTSERVVRIDLEEGSDEMSTFLALTFPLNLTRFRIWNKGNLSWNSEEMQTFLRLYGDKITHLEIDSLAIPIESPATVQFFEGLSNLSELRIHRLKENGYYDNSLSDYYRQTIISDVEEDEDDEDEVPQVEAPLPDLNLPSTFKRLKHLHISTTVECPLQLFFMLMEECSTHLEYINYPRPGIFSRFSAPGDVFKWVRRIVDTRHRENPNEPNLKYVDLARFWQHDFREDVFETYARSFYELVTTCSAHNTKLQNVDARVIEEMMKLDTPDRGLHGHKISRCVMSIRNIPTSVFSLELPLLEKIDITGTSDCSMPDGDFESQPWSNLKHLQFSVDSEHLAGNVDGEEVGVSRLFEFLFHGIRRENLESLELHFDPLPGEMRSYPEMTNVCSSCPNLKKLSLFNWPGSDRDIAQLWGNLPLLEDVTFDSCKTLGDAAFIGDDVTRPAIWKATRLKSLNLGDLNEVPGITDTLFTVALRHMPLKSLYLGSMWDPVSSFTLAGLESLLTGQFADTIEKFFLGGRIQLENVTDEQLAELERKFRSSQMWAESG